ncbi:MAG: FecR domain-containing protein [Caulobacteraceae bacterium]
MRVMTEFDQTNASAEALEDEGLAWVNRLLSGAVTSDEAEAFKSWRAKSAAHEAAFTEAVQFRRAIRRAIVVDRTDSARPATTTPTARGGDTSRRIARRSLLGGALAASAVGYLAARPPAGLWPSWSEFTSDYHTGAGERRAIGAASGVSMELNTRTSIARRSAISGEVELVSGEAAITARRASGAPFSVIAEGGRTLLTDGVVNLRKDGTSICVTCIRGAAEVIHPAGRIRLEAGRQVVYTPGALEPARAADVTLATAWRRGLLIFRDAPLQQVVDELNRYRPGKIVLVDAALARRPVYGVFQIQQIGRAVEQVQGLTGARATHLPGGLVLLS